MDGDTHGEGLVFVLGEDATWGSVCGDEWDKADADVVCKQMGFRDGAASGNTTLTTCTV
jgi:hypothetical protein